MARIKIGDLLVKAKLIDEMQLRAALAYQRQWGGKLGDALVAKGLLDEMMLWRGLSKQLAVPLVSLPEHAFPPGIERAVPVELCRKHSIVPLTRDNREVTIATSEPNNIAGIDEVAFRVGSRLKVVLAPDREIEWATRRLYNGEVAPCPPPRLRRVLAETEPDQGLQTQARGQMVDFTARGPSTPQHEVQGAWQAPGAAPTPSAVPAPFGVTSSASTAPDKPGVGAAGAGQAGLGAPGYGAPGHGAPGHGAPAHGAPGYGAPGYGAPAHGAPGHGAPGYGAPGFGAPGFGAPGFGAPGFGAPGFGAPGFGAGFGAAGGAAPAGAGDVPASGPPAFGAGGFGAPPPGSPVPGAAAASPFASGPPTPTGYAVGAGGAAESTTVQTEAALRETSALLRWIVEACIARGVFTRDEYVARVRAQQ